ncbi:GIY-YIG nuclease family protein [Kosmotoga pacifica]|uniref:GIY-YIG domain-containing protein n=1 Tax=Kosmotoga pacifica TaxID=1330330 RepID=A0A0G2Z630_9BACT|nr:DUF123 domain-containing protein [Kosmotoga pacifica]AKI96997.1 hypothetical protein IX53_03225 [Kosmotoga pacifica]
MDKGSYVLLIKVDKRLEVKTMARSFEIFPGYYCYIGSAMGTLSGRIGRHLKGAKKRFWHIDFLLTEARIVLAILVPSSIKTEERISRLFAKFGEAVEHFGASDCDTSSNLYQIKKENFFKALESVFEHMGVFK